MWVMCFYAKKKVFSEPVVGDVKAGGQREKKEMPYVLLTLLSSQQLVSVCP